MDLDYRIEVISCFRHPNRDTPGWACYGPFGKIFWKAIAYNTLQEFSRYFEIYIATDGKKNKFVASHGALNQGDLGEVLNTIVFNRLSELPLPLTPGNVGKTCACSSATIFQLGCQCKGA